MTYPLKYACYGALFGLCFPIEATLFSAWSMFGEIHLFTLVLSQLQTPLLWLIDSAPFFLGGFAWFGGLQYERVLQFHAAKRKLAELLKIENFELEEKIRARTELLEANIEKLVKADRVRTEFVSTVSHELRTPLTAIGGAIKLLNLTASGKLNSQEKTLLELAIRNSDLLASLINDILDIEKLDAGKLQLTLKTPSVSQLIEHAISMHGPYAESYQITLTLIESESDSSIYVDKRRFTQIKRNLLSNACKYSPSASEVTVFVEESHDRVRINVADQGSGIPQGFEQTIFDKFTQVDSSSSRSKGGTGLGLNITQSLVTSMGGEIGFHPNNDCGTVFYIDFPIASLQIPPQPVRISEEQLLS